MNVDIIPNIKNILLSRKKSIISKIHWLKTELEIDLSSIHLFVCYWKKIF